MNDALADILQRGDVAEWNQLQRDSPFDLAGLRLHRTSLKGARFDGANLQGAEFIGCDLKEASFVGANVQNGNFVKSSLWDANFGNAKASGARFDRISMPRVNFSNADLRGASIIGAWAETCVFEGADLSEAIFQGAQLSRSNFTKAMMQRADLRLADLRLAIFANANLTEAMLGGAALDRAVFDGAILTGTGYSVFKPTLVLPKPGSTKVPSEGDHWDVIFRRADKRAIYAGKQLLNARCVSCDLDRGREYQDKYLAEIVRTGGLLCIKEEAAELSLTDTGGYANRLGARTLYSLWLFDQCTFEQSLGLMSLFSLVPLFTSDGKAIVNYSSAIDWSDAAEREKYLGLIAEFLRDLRTRHRLVISEFMDSLICLRKIDEDNGSWSADVKRVMEFQKKVLNIEQAQWEERELRRYFQKSRSFSLCGR